MTKRYSKVAGIVLAGGRSTRMGVNKAHLSFRGKSLVAHMVEVLEQTGLQDIFVSGDVEGYQCLLDKTPYQGPAKAMIDLINQLQHHEGYEGILFVPIDMPLLTPEILQTLLKAPDGGYFLNWPLPAYIKAPYPRIIQAHSVRNLLNDLKIYPLEIPEKQKHNMINANTPTDFQKVLENEY